MPSLASRLLAILLLAGLGRLPEAARPTQLAASVWHGLARLNPGTDRPRVLCAVRPAPARPGQG